MAQEKENSAVILPQPAAGGCAAVPRPRLGFVGALTEIGTQISRITPGCPWENGYQESFYGRLKLSLGDTSRFWSLGELIYAVYQEIHRYNTSRIHSALTTPPAAFRQLYTKQKLSELVSKEMGS